ncbi:rod shape-determining protein MreC [Helicobacter turcicus]|uniref:Rod shape-determining protein MreC n=1 Tax=Helicobacter turcicus TaxID=2867412 RepID=A0ABS7JPX4_9HELI|nr:rod shape-determining protein MreC [Helicobacter turcicus]MBX7491415.1 rod shape-determining protein MreC [Helicobacter turcicus]MBX7546282.1 rod shape-determining protein MreC [Helicobacter turcicus]
MKKLFLWIVFLAVTFFLAIQVSKEFHAKVLYLSDAVKIGILNLNNNFSNIITRYFNQVQQIKNLTNALKDKEKLQYSYDALKMEHNALLQALESKPSAMQITLSRMISYVEMNNYTKVWLEQEEAFRQRENAIFGLISENKVAGIAVIQSNRLLGYLNGNEKCSYSVIIGNKKTPGVAKYDLNRGFVVDYIPLYPKVEVGEQVYTSGFDEIFYPGVLVGIVESVEEQQGYQIASIKPDIERAVEFYWLVDIDGQKAELTLEENIESKTEEPKIFNFGAQE